MIVCLCHRVSESDIERAAAAGCASFEELQRMTLIATICGTCRECAEKTFLGASRRPAACVPQAEVLTQSINAWTAK